jgi:phage terminase large subunit
MGEAWYAQEYENSFGRVQGLVYPDFQAQVHDFTPPEGKRLGGIDWGWNAPFAAVWGVLDRATDTLYLENERYLRATRLHLHKEALKPLNVTWLADPQGASELQEFRAAGLTIHKANKHIRPGIAAVTARLQTKRLVIHPRCENLIAEANLYRYPEDGSEEIPVDEYNHALDALRYLVAHVDKRYLARLRTGQTHQPQDRPHEAREQPSWRNPDTEALWTPI